MAGELLNPDGDRLLTLTELCAWLNITERHARKLVERDAIPYRKIGHLLRFSAREVDAWSRPDRRPATEPQIVIETPVKRPPRPSSSAPLRLPKSLLD
ncbi:helix-turn-helix domain-containing protein [Kineosporia sp. J2-2]|uniref:Helix-turn-helix domain-containing protein n=1 Tax=Kineosporia corallincola TaxID=2835133 RepID=A0ABS5TJI3_9ACTN|nr:helix-turn-helix domain-containing protein [Kineosporia corallincola]MBT0771256.1 helix-turn-helix domain-containing protein [Kineosporia corallincola]